MERNKSIDGLAPRRAKTATPKNAPSKKPTTKLASKSVVPTIGGSSVNPQKPTTKATKVTKATKPTKAKKSARSTVKTVNPQPTPQVQTPTPAPTEQTLTEAEINADFLKPTQVFNFDEQSGELQASDQASDPTSDQASDPTSGSASDQVSAQDLEQAFSPSFDQSQTTDSEPTKSKKPKKAKKPVSKKRKIITSIILVIVLLLIGGVTWLVLWGNDIIAKITGGQGNVFDLITFIEPTYERLKTDDNGRTNILAIGTSGYNMEGDEGNGTHDGAQLTDSIMVISLNQDTGDIAMLSLPRDLKASPTCTATGKINEVYWCNGGGGDASLETEATAAQAVMDEVGDILDIDFQYFAHLNWGSLIQIVDTLGGINITLDEGIYDYNWTGAVFEPGVEYTINGEQAVGLARARHGTTGGDFSRGASQQKILIGIKNKISEKELSLTDIMSLASTLGDNLRSNFSLEEIKSLAHLSFEFDFDSMRQISLYPDYMTTGTINGISYVLPRGGAGYYTNIQDYVAKMLSNDPRVYEEATILVLNGTETPYLASNEQTTLEKDGYTNITADNAPEGEYPDEYALYVLTDTAPGTLELLEEKYQLTAKSADELPESISHGYDFVLILGGSTTDDLDSQE